MSKTTTKTIAGSGATRGMELIARGLILLAEQFIADYADVNESASDEVARTSEDADSPPKATKAAKKTRGKAKTKAKKAEEDATPDGDDATNNITVISMNDCRNAMIGVIKSSGTKVGRGLLESFNVKKAADLDPEQFADFVEACEAME